MKLIRYAAGGVHLEEAPAPDLPAGGLLVQTEACGLCSGELMAWYMDAKGTPVLGHEVAGKVVASEDKRFPIGSRVYPHHHAPCGVCEQCQRGAYVQCETWERTRLVPGGMAEFFAVGPENLADTHRVDDLRAVDAALAEPLSCVVKSLTLARWKPGQRSAVIGLGNMGLLHMLALDSSAVGYDTNLARVEHARSIGVAASPPESRGGFDVVFVCPGSYAALEQAINIVAPRGTILLFAPFGGAVMPPGILDKLYFNDITLATSYSAGPDDSLRSLEILRSGRIKAEHIVEEFVAIEELPRCYDRMRAGELLKAMVLFSTD